MKPLVGPGRQDVRFETEDQGVKALVTDLPAEAYGEGQRCLLRLIRAAPVASSRRASIPRRASLLYGRERR